MKTFIISITFLFAVTAVASNKTFRKISSDREPTYGCAVWESEYPTVTNDVGGTFGEGLAKLSCDLSKPFAFMPAGVSKVSGKPLVGICCTLK